MMILLGTIVSLIIALRCFKMKGDFEKDLLSGMLIFIIVSSTFIIVNFIDMKLSSELDTEIIKTEYALIPYKNGKIVDKYQVKGVTYEKFKLDNGNIVTNPYIYLDKETDESYLIKKHTKAIEKSKWLIHDMDVYDYYLYLNEKDYKEVK